MIGTCVLAVNKAKCDYLFAKYGQMSLLDTDFEKEQKEYDLLKKEK